MQQAHVVQLQALENTGKYDGAAGLALADTLFALSGTYRRMLSAQNVLDGASPAGAAGAGPAPGPTDAQLQNTAEHCLTLCLFLRTTLLGCHLQTVLAYAEIGEFFKSQRRWGPPIPSHTTACCVNCVVVCGVRAGSCAL